MIVKKINKELASRGKQPVSVIGPKESDLFYAARDKFPESGGAGLPWYDSLAEFLKAVEAL